MPGPSRRDFLTAVAALPGLPPLFRGDPYRPWTPRPASLGAVRARGRVASWGRGLAGVAVSDGLSVVTTDRQGRFELVTDSSRRHLSVSVPAGYHLPRSRSGTLRAHRPIVADSKGEMAAAFDLEPIDGGDRRHGFLVLADIQTQDQADMARFQSESVPDLGATIARLGEVPLFGVGDGDIVWDRLAMFDDYETAVAKLGIPFVQVVGNHDLDLGAKTDEDSTATFEGRFGPRYYSFDRGEIHYVVLDDVFYHGEGYLGYVGADQLTWLANDLARIEAGRSVVVFAHIPFMTGFADRQGQKPPGISNHVVNREAVYQLLARYRTTVLTGHIHESDWATTGSIAERNLGAVCGGWWTGDICYDGTPSGYGVYQVDGSTIRWRYQATGKDPGHQLRVYPRGADPVAPEEIVANVWAYEPGWSVVWYQGGDRRGEMARRVGLDPLAWERHAGDLPARRPWVDPVKTGHLFYAPVPAGAGPIRVEATDPWGQIHSEILR